MANIKIKEVNAQTILTMPNGDVIVKKMLIRKMEEIIGLSYDQFKMTMMIAQGDFFIHLLMLTLRKEKKYLEKNF
ncbi:MAG: hypothetical protein L6U99_01240 [Clostridium sp.]|nr:MAG: hypothetical protein L6U99_01240 [Clostridium sp.]